MAYADRVHASHDDALQAAFDAPGNHGMPAIQVSPSEGKVLTLLLRLLEAKRVVEVGTLAGYSALRIVAGLAPGGRLYSLELEPQHAKVATEILQAAGVADRVEIRLGSALEQLQQLEPLGPFDAVFLDADKGGYLDYLHWAERNLRSGGMLIADNSYLFGNLLAETDVAQRMRRFHEELANRFDSVCVPTPDGLVVGLRR